MKPSDQEPTHRSEKSEEPPPGDSRSVESEAIDNINPPRRFPTTPMVGLGGSAGSIHALAEFFKSMPPDSGMVFVVVLHLSPTHTSTMAELLTRSTAMNVVQAEDGQKVEPNRVYVIPPGKYLATTNGHLKLTDSEQERGKRVTVDLFFRSLADTYGPNAAAVVLSGADGDGALGIKRIKERGGLTIAQDPDEAEFSAMPSASIGTGMVDWVLKIAEIPTRLLKYYNDGARLKLPPEESPSAQTTADDGETALRDVLVFLRSRTGRDFSYYKRATILRRIARRMQVNGVEDMPAYLGFLRSHPGETGALLQDLLISVTNFFRDREVFEVLAKRIPRLFENKSLTDPVRVWVPACATGEEAYSLAILLLEHARTIENSPPLQVFACDLDEEAIQIARAGHYPDTIAADVSEDRLRRYFVKDHKGYRVRAELREMILFATHDLLKDAPFSRMDLISCRNLLIYLNREAQRRVFDTFHFALKPGGVLLLGASEVVDDGNPLFRVVDKKYRLYERQQGYRSGLHIPSGASALSRAIEAQQQSQATPVVHGKRFGQAVATPFHRSVGSNLDRMALADLHFTLIERYAPPSVIVNADHEIVHLSEHAGDFLNFIGGEPSINLLRVVHPMLRIELRAALFRAAESGKPVQVMQLPAEFDGVHFTVDINVVPTPEIAPGFLLVIFDKKGTLPPPGAARENASSTTLDSVARHLERELDQVKTHLGDTVEQYEASAEELKASNEELQAMNEELRSATEELETNREELQSINEELTTVNQEMKSKVDELAKANADLQNLMASTLIPTIFLDRQLSITGYTPSAVALFSIIPGDLGRPLADLNCRLDYPELIADAERVLQTRAPIEREVSDGNRWYLARCQPYRTADNEISGVVLNLVDVTERVRAVEGLRRSEERLRLLIESAKDYAIFTVDLELRVDSWNSGAEAIFGYPEREIVGQSSLTLFTGDDQSKGDPQRETRLAREEGRAVSERWHTRKDGSIFFGSGSVMPLRDHTGQLRGFVKIIRDLTESKRTQEALQMDELTRFNKAAVGRESRMIELKAEINELCARLGEAARYPLNFE